MNIFYTNENPRLAARDHCTIHTNKMIIEYTQLLSTAHHILEGDQAYLLAKFKEWQPRDKPLQVVFDRVPSWYV